MKPAHNNHQYSAADEAERQLAESCIGVPESAPKSEPREQLNAHEQGLIVRAENERLIRRAEPLVSEIENHEEAAKAWSLLGHGKLTAGRDSGEVSEAFDMARERACKIHNCSERQRALSSAAGLAIALEDPDRELAIRRQVRQVFGPRDHFEGILDGLRGCLDRGVEPARVRPWVEYMLEIHGKAAELELEKEMYAGFPEMIGRAGDLEAAERIARWIGEGGAAYQALSSVGVLQFSRGESSLAEGNFAAAGEMLRKVEPKSRIEPLIQVAALKAEYGVPGWTRDLGSAVECCRALKDYDYSLKQKTCVALFELGEDRSAEQLAAELENDEKRSQVYRNSAETLLQRGQRERGEALMDLAIEFAASHAAESFHSGIDQLRWAAEGCLQSGYRAGARKAFERALSVAEAPGAKSQYHEMILIAQRAKPFPELGLALIAAADRLLGPGAGSHYLADVASTQADFGDFAGARATAARPGSRSKEDQEALLATIAAKEGRFNLAIQKLGDPEEHFGYDRSKAVGKICGAMARAGAWELAIDTARLPGAVKAKDEGRFAVVETAMGRIRRPDAADQDAGCYAVAELGHKARRQLLAALGVTGSSEQIEASLSGLSGRDRSILEALSLREAVRFGGPSASGQEERAYYRAEHALAEALRKGAGGKEELRYLCEALLALDTHEARNLLLSTAREVWAGRPTSPSLPRLLKSAAECSTFRSNDFVQRVASDDRLDLRLGRYLIGKLVENGHFDGSVGTWLADRADSKDRARKSIRKQREAELGDGLAIRKLLAAGITPSGEVLDYVVRKRWKDGAGRSIAGVEDRIARLGGIAAEVSNAAGSPELIASLAADRGKALPYYLVNVGRSRYDLINNYSFKKFFELVTLASEMKTHEQPIERFERALRESGIGGAEVTAISANLRAGRHPFHSDRQPTLERLLRLDISDQAQLDAANGEISQVLGSKQLGVCLKSPLYRSYLARERSELAGELLADLGGAQTLSERLRAIERIEESFTGFPGRAAEQLAPGFGKAAQKIGLRARVEELLGREANPVECESFVRQVEESRLSLKHAKEELLVALRSENPRLKRLDEDIRKKQAAIRKLQPGLERNPALAPKIEEIGGDIAALEEEKKAIGGMQIERRYERLSPEERKALIEREAAELRALGSKNAAAIGVYLMMEALGDVPISEGDVNLAKEIASHLEQPLRVVADLAGLDERGRKISQERLVRLRWLDKKDDLLNCARFADSKICCFSSSNYEMHVAHSQPNKQWVASILRDPLSFVFEIEELPGGAAEENGGAEPVRRNIGFVFGMFGVAGSGKLDILSNGLYLSIGNDPTAAASVFNAVVEMIGRPLGAERALFASKHGGSISGEVPGYEKGEIESTRLRALDDEHGEPETKIYDDLGQVANEPASFEGFHRRIAPESR